MLYAKDIILDTSILLNPEAATFQRQFVSDLKRCEELRYIESEYVKTDIVAAGCGYDEGGDPAPREVAEEFWNIHEPRACNW